MKEYIGNKNSPMRNCYELDERGLPDWKMKLRYDWKVVVGDNVSCIVILYWKAPIYIHLKSVICIGAQLSISS